MALTIHPTAEISEQATIGEGTRIWQHVQIRENAVVGPECVLGKGVYIDTGVIIGKRTKIQNYVSIYSGVTVEDGVFIGPHVCFTNDRNPRAINLDLSPKEADDWELVPTRVLTGASLGANATIRCGVTIGRWVMVGAGSVVTHDVPDYGLVWGNPARLHGFVCPCGKRLEPIARSGTMVITACPTCQSQIEIEEADWDKIYDQQSRTPSW